MSDKKFVEEAPYHPGYEDVGFKNRVMKPILYSPGYGAGWTTWNSMRDTENSLVNDPILVELVELKNKYDSGTKEFNDVVDRIVKRAEEVCPDGYFGGADDLVVEWVPEGTMYIIDEYDGSESIKFKENDYWSVA